MLSYIARRLLMMIPLVLGITIITFLVIHLAPGTPTDIQTQMNPKVSAEARERLKRIYGLDKPLYRQYVDWLGRLARLDFGNSFTDGRSVMEKIRDSLPITIIINTLSLFLIFVVAIPIGVLSAAKQYSLFDKLTTISVFIGFSAPTFWLALLLMILLGVRFNLLPISGIKSLYLSNPTFWNRLLDYARHLVLPVFVSAFGGLAGLSRYTRSNMLEVVRQDYIRTARAKGLSERSVIYKHALRNALMPVITILGLSVPGLIGGSVIFETIFSIPGMGQLFYGSVMARDYPVIMGILFIGAILTLFGNLLADISYAIVDPRISYQ
ncbi:MAG: ABC transporter permease [bacterium]